MGAKKNNLWIILAIVAAFVAIAFAVIYFTMPSLIGLGGNNQAANTPTTAPAPQPAPTAASAPAAPAAKPAVVETASKTTPAAKAAAAKAAAAKAAAAKAKQKSQLALATKPASPALAAGKGPAGAKPGAVQVASTAGAPPNARPDPFVIPGVRYTPPPRPSVASIAPPPIVTTWAPAPVLPPHPGPGPGTINVASLPNDRVSGIMLQNGVYAIVESSGQSQVVQPGDTLPGGEKVVSIQGDSVTFRPPGSDQTVSLPLSAGSGGPMPAGGVPGGYQAMPAGYAPGGNPYAPTIP